MISQLEALTSFYKRDSDHEHLTLIRLKLILDAESEFLLVICFFNHTLTYYKVGKLVSHLNSTASVPKELFR